MTVRGAIRRPRVGRLDVIGELMPEENNDITTGTVIDVGGVQASSADKEEGHNREKGASNAIWSFDFFVCFKKSCATVCVSSIQQDTGIPFTTIVGTVSYEEQKAEKLALSSCAS